MSDVVIPGEQPGKINTQRSTYFREPAQKAKGWSYPVSESKRDLRLDLLRGFAALAMLIDHIGGKNSLLYLISGGDRFFVSAAEGFVFISGLVMGIVYAGVLAKKGLRAGIIKGARRVATLYGLTILLSLVFAVLSLETKLSWAPDFNSLEGFITFVRGIVTMHQAYYLTDVLLLYTLVIAASLPALALMHRFRASGWLVLAGSWALWGAWQLWPRTFVLPFGLTSGDIFVFPAWQVLFVTGLVLGFYRNTIEQTVARSLRGRKRGVVQSAALVVSGSVVATSIGLYLWAQAHPQYTATITQLGQLFGKSDLRIGRLALFACLFTFLFLVCTFVWVPVKRMVGRVLLPMGQDALTVYTLHLFALVVIATGGVALLGAKSESLLGRTALQAVGIAAIWGIVRAKSPARAFIAATTAGIRPRIQLRRKYLRVRIAAWIHSLPVPIRTKRAANRLVPQGRVGLGLVGLLVSALLLVPGSSVVAKVMKHSSVVAAISGTPVVAAATTPMPTESAVAFAEAFATAGPSAAGTPAPASNNSLGMMMSGTAAPVSNDTPTPVVLQQYVEQRTFVSTTLNRSMPLYVYLPPSYAAHPDARYPVLYMLHGMSGTDTEWLGYGLMGKARDMMVAGQIGEFIIVLPQGDQGYWVDHPTGGPQWGTYVARDVVSEVDRDYRTLADREHRAIGGLSMGGSGALGLAILYPDVFGAVSASSPSLHDYATSPAFYGSREFFTAHDPMYLYAANPDVARTLLIYVDVGQEDSWMPAAANFNALLDLKGIPHEWHTFAGGHEGTYWSTHVPDYLRFFSTAMKAASAEASTSVQTSSESPTASPTLCASVSGACAE